MASAEMEGVLRSNGEGNSTMPRAGRPSRWNVRRRLVQKMDFLLEDEGATPAPSEEELQLYLTAHLSRYAVPDRLTIRHVFVSRERHGDTAQVATGLRDALLSGTEPASLGDPFVRGSEFRLLSEKDLAGIFGTAFARQVSVLESGTWSGPIESSFGSHLVLVSERRPGRSPDLAAVREYVTRDWWADRRELKSREALDRLQASYTVRVEGEVSKP